MSGENKLWKPQEQPVVMNQNEKCNIMNAYVKYLYDNKLISVPDQSLTSNKNDSNTKPT